LIAYQGHKSIFNRAPVISKSMKTNKSIR